MTIWVMVIYKWNEKRTHTALSAKAVEYADCISEEG